MGLIRNFTEAVRFASMPDAARRIVFYSEGAEYWTHLGDLLSRTLELTDRDVCYLTSDANDPGLELSHPRLRAFVTDRKHFRDWLLGNMTAGLCVMTMPDLDRMQVRRSPGTAHYVYVPHSPVSLHMAYRPGAFDHYDTLFCAGPHHMREARALERSRGTAEKNLVEQGYARLDRMKAAIAPGKRKNVSPHVLIAPSWGSNGLVETGCAELVEALLENGLSVTLRPHPQTARLRPDAVTSLTDKFGSHPSFAFERDVNGWSSFDRADTMISDWSGAALEFAFVRRRPIVFLDTPPKANNPDYHEVNLDPVEKSIRERIGRLCQPGDTPGIVAAVRACLSASDLPQDITDAYVFNPGQAAAVGARHIAALAERDGA